MKYNDRQFIYIDNDNPPIGEIEYTIDNEICEINFNLNIRGVMDTRESDINEFKKELEQLLRKYLI